MRKSTSQNRALHAKQSGHGSDEVGCMADEGRVLDDERLATWQVGNSVVDRRKRLCDHARLKFLVFVDVFLAEKSRKREKGGKNE